MRRFALPVLAASMLLLAACSGMKMRVKPAGAPEPGVQHVVLVELDDPKLAAEMTKDMQEAFAQIPTLRRWEIGTHIDTGRPMVQRWYTLGVLAQFDGVADYEAFVAHPRHKALAEKWKPHWKRAEIFDFGVASVKSPAAGAPDR